MKEININVKIMHNVEVWLKRANEDDFKLVKEAHNTTEAALKSWLCSAMNGDNEEYMGFNLLFSSSVLGGIMEKDGIIVDVGASYYSMITTVHATDPSGNYYRRWQGILTAPAALNFLGGVYLGTKFDAAGHFDYPWDSDSLSAWSMAAGDILRINWKVSFS